MREILTTRAMRAADAAAVAATGQDALVERAGHAVALEAVRLLGGSYGRRVGVVCGPGLNGADGRVAARELASRGCHVEIFDALDLTTFPPSLDLLIDAAFGLGCSRPFTPPPNDAGTPVLAVDLPSGVEADGAFALGSPWRADVTVALGALKRAHVLEPTASLCGVIRLHRLGIVDGADDGLVEDRDLAEFVRSSPSDHKWHHALGVVAGSPLMPGAAQLVCRGALSAGASMVRLTSFADVTTLDVPPEVVRSTGVLDDRVRAVVAGPGIGVEHRDEVRMLLEPVRAPLVLDADALERTIVDALAGRPLVLTPHEGEFARLAGRPIGDDRIGDVRALARDTSAVVLLKGPSTIVASPDGRVRIVRAGTSALSTAGTGDVLAGMIGAAIARGHDEFDAAALSAHLHGLAGRRLLPYEGASALGDAVTRVLDELRLQRFDDDRRPVGADL